MEQCKHKFRTNLDGVTVLGNGQLKVSPYVTIVFCENCGLIVKDANWSDVGKEYQRSISRPIIVNKPVDKHSE